MKKINFSRAVICCLVFSAPLGADILSLSLLGYKLSLFRFFLLVAIIYYIGDCIKNRVFLNLEKKSRYSIIFMFLLLVYSIISVLWCFDFKNYIRSLYFIFVGVFAVLVSIRYLSNISVIQFIMKVLNASIFLQSIIAWYGILLKDIRFVNILSNGSISPLGFCGNTNDFASLLFVGILISLIMAVYSTDKKKQLLNYFASFDYLVLFMLTDSRANLLALFCSFSFLVMFGRNKKWIYIFSVFVILVLFPKLFNELQTLDVYKDQIIENTVQVARDSNISNEIISQGSISIRINLILNGLVFLVRTRFLGVGCGQFESWMRNYSVFPTSGVLNMHNWWFEILVCYGLFIFIAYLVFYIKLFYNSFKVRNENDARQLSLLVCSFMCGFIFASISSSSNITVEWLWLFWGICVAFQNVTSKDVLEEKKII